jgi:hypothetical protein
VVPQSDGVVVGDRMSIANMTCHFFEQPLNHFVPRGKSPSYQERYCTYDGYASVSTGVDNSNDEDEDPAPIFFYTGNESPLEQYINQVNKNSQSLVSKLSFKIFERK